MRLTLRDSLAFTQVTVAYRGREVEIPDVVVDTGSAATVLSADCVARAGIIPEPDDILYTVRGIGGTEVVFSRQVDRLRVGAYSAEQFQIEVGGLDYGFEMNGILGMDFLLHATAVINLGTLEIEFSDREGGL